jgi:hypothetical protein
MPPLRATLTSDLFTEGEIGYKRAKTNIGSLALSIQRSIKEMAVHSVIVNITSVQVVRSYGPIRRSRR